MKKRKGFTIVELLVVVTIIGLLAFLALGYSMRSKDRWTLRDLSREFSSSFYEMRMRAARENSPCIIEFNSSNTFSTWFLDGALWRKLKDFPTGEKVTIQKNPVGVITPNGKPGFAINSSGFIVDPITRQIIGTQTVVLRVPRGIGFDSIVISIFPYGGMRVENHFI